MQAGAAAAACAAGAATAAGAAGAARAAEAAAGRFSQVPAGESQKSSPAATIRADPTTMAMVVFFMTFLPDDRQLRSGRSRRVVTTLKPLSRKRPHLVTLFRQFAPCFRLPYTVRMSANRHEITRRASNFIRQNWADPQIVVSAFHAFRTLGMRDQKLASQNLGHFDVLAAFRGYGTVPMHRQCELIRLRSAKDDCSAPNDANLLAALRPLNRGLGGLLS
jgi:hypothetical protein